MNHFANQYMVFAFAVGIGLQALVTEIPYFVALFGTSRLSLREWAILAGLSAMPLAVHELLLIAGVAEKKDGCGRQPGGKWVNTQETVK